MASHECTWRGCGEPVTVLMVDVFAEHPLFGMGAALLCEHHARGCDDKGARVKIPRDVRKRMRL